MTDEIILTFRDQASRDIASISTYGVALSQYPDGTPLIAGEGIRSQPGLPIAMTVRPRSFQSFMAAMMLAESMDTSQMVLNLPFVPGARQDRRNSTGDILFTLKSVADIINARDFRQVYMMDPHSEVAPALINRSVVIPAHECFYPSDVDKNGRWDAVLAPDAGAYKRAEGFSKFLGVPMFHGWKHRDVSTGALTGFGCNAQGPCHVLVVDDICDGGGTFLGLGAMLEQKQCSADLFVTHGLFTKGQEGINSLLKYFKQIYTTDSVLRGNVHGFMVNPAVHNRIQAK
jgi:ribose-phosphate pyrophosphokinase